MKLKRRPAWLASALVFALLFVCPTVLSDHGSKAPRGKKAVEQATVVRVGVISYDAYASGVKKYGDELRALSRAYHDKTGRKVVFQLAVGSYSDVLDWYNKELVDVAFLTPQPVAELRAALKDDELKRRYIATHATSGNPQPVFEYSGACYVAKNTPIETAAELKEQAEKGHVSFLFVDPLSLSGRILPEYLLRSPDYGITNIKVNTANQHGLNAAAYTYSRMASINALVEQEEIDSLFTADQPGQTQQPQDANFVAHQKWPVAFFYDGTIPPEYRERIKRVSFPELESKKLPEEVALVTPSFLAHRDKLLELFRVDQPGSFFQTNPYPGSASWLDRFADVSEWVEKLDISSRDPHNQMFTLERIGKILRNYETQHGQPARLALVLSGGGAKCSYQLGAIRALESEVAVEPETEEERKVDIDLVVGTSGGAINALTVALGLTKGGQGEKSMRNNERLIATWKGFGPKDFFSPWGTAYYLLALTTAVLQAVLLIWLFLIVRRVGKFFHRDFSWLYRHLGLAMIALAALDALVQLSGWRFGRLFNLFGIDALAFAALDPHWWEHISLLLTFDLYVTAILLAVIGAGVHLWLRRRPKEKTAKGEAAEEEAAKVEASKKIGQEEAGRERIRSRFRDAHTFMRNALLVAVGVLVVYSFFWEKTLSQSSIVESTLAEKITELVSPAAGAELKSAEKRPTVASLSQKYIRPGLVRDLVITGSLLEDTPAKAEAEGHMHASLPPDIYFFHDQEKCTGSKAAQTSVALCDPDPPSDAQRRFRSFGFRTADGDASHLLDVVIGSSSIYPIFPARRLHDVGNIVDGGFAHNSPIEAAVMWKATHIILVEASPLSPTNESYLLQNAQNALNHLYFQAQLSDLRARGKVEMFTLRPEVKPDEPSMCTFDFNADAIERAILRGGMDAKNDMDPRFERVPGEPLFEEVDFDNITTKNVNCPCSQNPANGTNVAGIK